MEVVPIHYKVSEQVKRYYQIEDDAAQMMQMLDNRGFKGLFDTGYAISHAQVSQNPFSFFVLDYRLVEKSMFEDRVIINPKILKAPLYHEFREPVGRKVNFLECEEGCLSFPYRKPKRLNRYNRILVTYQVKGGFFGFKRIKRWLTGEASQIFQHEYDHCQGNNIFFTAK